jgi:monoamine oxidase
MTGYIWLEHISLAHFLREVTALSAKTKIAIAGGFQKLADAFIHSLRRAGVGLKTHTEVIGVSLAEGKATVRWRYPAGAVRNQEYDRVICAVPAAAALNIAFEPALPKIQRDGLASISYLSASKSGAYFARRFWETDLDPPKLGGVTRTNLPNQQIWYPNDNVQEQMGDAELVNGTFEAGPPGTSPRERAFIPFTRTLKDPARSEGRGAVLAAYMWGQNAQRFAGLSKAEQDDLIVKCLEEVYPGCSNSLIDLIHWPWNNQSNPGGGGFAWYCPGQQSRYQSHLTRPHRLTTESPNIVCFAGEHLGLIQGWIQGAMQTALSAVVGICGGRD